MQLEESKKHDQEHSSIGLEPNMAAFLSYLLGLIGGILFFSLEKENKFIRFHALQSIFLFVCYFIFAIAVWVFNFMSFFLTNGLVFCITFPLFFAVIIGFIITWIIIMIKAYQGEYYKLPIIGNMAEQQIK